jgi:hypothetical protein
MARVKVGQGMAGQNYCVVGGCLLSLSFCRRGFFARVTVSPEVSVVTPFANTLGVYCSFREPDKTSHPRGTGQFNFFYRVNHENLTSVFKFKFENSKFPVTHPVSCNFFLLKAGKVQFYG